MIYFFLEGRCYLESACRFVRMAQGRQHGDLSDDGGLGSKVRPSRVVQKGGGRWPVCFTGPLFGSHGKLLFEVNPSFVLILRDALWILNDINNTKLDPHNPHVFSGNRVAKTPQKTPSHLNSRHRRVDHHHPRQSPSRSRRSSIGFRMIWVWRKLFCTGKNGCFLGAAGRLLSLHELLPISFEKPWYPVDNARPGCGGWTANTSQEPKTRDCRQDI